jgi:hypothetical protein
MSSDLEKLTGDLVALDPEFKDQHLGVWVPEDRSDHEGMLEATRELMLQGLRRPVQVARYLGVTTARAAMLLTEVEAAFVAGMKDFDPSMNRARAAAAANLVQTHAMHVFHNSMNESAKLAALKIALAAQKQESEVLRLTGQKSGNTSVTIDNSDRRTAIQMQLEQLQVPSDVMDQLADQFTEVVSTGLKKGRR